MLESDPYTLSDVAQAEEDIAALSAVFLPRIEQARRGESSTK